MDEHAVLQPRGIDCGEGVTMEVYVAREVFLCDRSCSATAAARGLTVKPASAIEH